MTILIMDATDLDGLGSLLIGLFDVFGMCVCYVYVLCCTPNFLSEGTSKS